jgi:hypothetical protein
VDGTETSQASVLPVGELEIGAEYGRDLGRAYLVVQLGFVGQVWWGAGNAANSTVLNGSSFRADNASNLGLVGLAFRLGLSF